MENNNSPFDIVFTSLYHRVFQEFSRISVCMSVETTNKEDKCLIWKKYSEELIILRKCGNSTSCQIIKNQLIMCLTVISMIILVYVCIWRRSFTTDGNKIFVLSSSKRKKNITLLYKGDQNRPTFFTIRGVLLFMEMGRIIISSHIMKFANAFGGFWSHLYAIKMNFIDYFFFLWGLFGFVWFVSSIIIFLFYYYL